MHGTTILYCKREPIPSPRYRAGILLEESCRPGHVPEELDGEAVVHKGVAMLVANGASPMEGKVALTLIAFLDGLGTPLR